LIIYIGFSHSLKITLDVFHNDHLLRKLWDEYDILFWIIRQVR
jgi:hypothetical protein